MLGAVGDLVGDPVSDTLFESDLKDLPLLNRGKVRDIYAVGDAHMLIVTTDRLSAFDVVLPTPIRGKGRVLTGLSNFWFARTRHLVPNHLTDFPLGDAVPDPGERSRIEDRAVVVRRLDPLPIEAIVRGYLAGSGWNDYQRTGGVCGIAFPSGLRQADRLPEPIFTPSTKAAKGAHDENISFDQAVGLVGGDVAGRVREASLEIYRLARDYAESRGIIVADTKFEFALDATGRLVLIDEVLTPDSSRFWPADSYAPGASPPSFDKQFVRDWLESIGWDKRPPAPALPPDIADKTAAKYQEAYDRLVDGSESV
ncbi:MAG: phosphoribosylaminoimidazolesuccinocarboxamide synthase [Proteobacteria bacterium]|nr:phosphoribosylaminoimidazolesuccinocarboxamide synthase [Pseudomonadota bacterium]